MRIFDGTRDDGITTTLTIAENEAIWIADGPDGQAISGMAINNPVNIDRVKRCVCSAFSANGWDEEVERWQWSERA